MAEGRIENIDRLLWNHTSEVIAKIHNVNVTEKSHLITSDAVHPYRRREAKLKPRMKVPITALKAFLPKRGKSNGS